MHIKLNRILIFLLSILPWINSSGQILPLHNYTMMDNLVSDNILSLCQDSLGKIWIGTWEGISVYDSREFQNFSQDNGLSSDRVSCLIAEKNNSSDVWIGTFGGGIDRYHSGKFFVYGSNLSQRLKTIYSLYEDKNKNIWCGTDSGFYFIQNDSIHLVNVTSNLGWVSSFTQLSNDVILIGSEKGLFKFSLTNDQLNRVKLSEASNQSIAVILKNKIGVIYAATKDGDLYKITNSGSANILLHEGPRTMIEDNQNNLWIGTSSGLIKIDENNFSGTGITKYKTDNGLLQNNVSSLLLDDENILWMGTNDNGISKLTYQNLLKYRIPKKFMINNWASVVSDSNNHFWLALRNNLLEVWKDKSNTWQEHFHLLKNYASKVNLPSLFYSRKNNFFVTNPEGIIFYYVIKNKYPYSDVPSQLLLKEEIKIPAKVKFTLLYRIIEDNNGYLWCSALDAGIFVINKDNPGKILKIYTIKNGLPDNSVREIYQDRNNNIWFGGYDGGLSVFSYGKILNDLNRNPGNKKIFSKLFTTSNGLPNNDVRSIKENDEGKIFIGTRYGGLAIFNNTKLIQIAADNQDKKDIEIINRDSGLVSNDIWSLTKTPGGNFWIGTQSGVQQLSNNGIPGFELYEELPKVPYYSVCSSADGKFCFANQSDFYIYEPAEKISEKIHPPIYISHVLINGEEEQIKNNFTLANYQNTITIEFVGINYLEGKNTIYKYRLLNNDKNWNTLKNRNSVTYASLHAGSYTFQVVAINGEGIKSAVPAELNFKIEVPLYEEWWFVALVLMVLSVSIALIFRMRFKRLIEIEKIRTRIAADLHDEIGSGLTRIAILSENALQESGSDLKTLTEHNHIVNEKYSRDNSVERVGKIARDLVDSMIDVIWSIDPKYDSLNDFVFNFQNYAYEVCEAKKINLKIESKNIDKVKINSQTKRCLQLITKEALNNSLKYSDCSLFKLFLTVKNRNLNLEMEDDGVGFDMNKVKHGRGLFNIAKHVKELSGTFDLLTGPGKGSKISIKFPIQS